MRAHAVALSLLLSTTALADPRVFYCNAGLATGANTGASWTDAFRGTLALQSALSAAHAGDQIWLAQGVYKPAAPGAPRTSTFNLVPGVSLLGGFAGTESSPAQRTPNHTTTLSADINNTNLTWPNGSTNAARVLTGIDLDASTVLDSLTVFAAVATLGNDPYNNTGGGLLILRGAPSIRSCTFRSNATGWLGGGAACINATPTFEDCTFDGNFGHSGHNLASLGTSVTTVRRCRFIGDCHVAGGASGVGILSGPLIQNNDQPQLLVEDCFFSMAENPFSCPAGMGVYASQGSATILRSDFINNKSCGGGGGVSGNATFTIDRCRFIGNEGSADGGAAIHTFGGHYTITNSLFHANDREGFSTISALGGSFHAVNCTFSSNGSTTGLGGGSHSVILSSIPQALIENCIFWGNITRSGNPVFQSSGGVCRFDDCLVQGWNGAFTGARSFAADPRFVDINGPDNILGNTDDDLRLLAVSPAIDRANNNAIATPLDLAGLPRFRDNPATPDNGQGAAPFADLGAYEFQPPCPADFNGDDFLDFFDADAFTECFQGTACPPGKTADFNLDGFIDFFDLDAYIAAFEAGC